MAFFLFVLELKLEIYRQFGFLETIYFFDLDAIEH